MPGPLDDERPATGDHLTATRPVHEPASGGPPRCYIDPSCRNPGNHLHRSGGLCPGGCSAEGRASCLRAYSAADRTCARVWCSGGAWCYRRPGSLPAPVSDPYCADNLLRRYRPVRRVDGAAQCRLSRSFDTAKRTGARKVRQFKEFAAGLHPDYLTDMSESVKKTSRIMALATPTRFLALTDTLLPLITGFAALPLAVGLFMAFTAPEEYQQGITVRIMYIHVPFAWLPTLGCTMIASA